MNNIANKRLALRDQLAKVFPGHAGGVLYALEEFTRALIEDEPQPTTVKRLQTDEECSSAAALKKLEDMIWKKITDKVSSDLAVSSGVDAETINDQMIQVSALQVTLWGDRAKHFNPYEGSIRLTISDDVANPLNDASIAIARRMLMNLPSFTFDYTGLFVFKLTLKSET